MPHALVPYYGGYDFGIALSESNQQEKTYARYIKSI